MDTDVKSAPPTLSGKAVKTDTHYFNSLKSGLERSEDSVGDKDEGAVPYFACLGTPPRSAVECECRKDMQSCDAELGRASVLDEDGGPASRTKDQAKRRCVSNDLHKFTEKWQL